MADLTAIVVPGAVLDAVVAEARAAAPAECCGLLIGCDARVDRVVPARNVAGSPSRYQVAPEDHFAALRAARADGLAVVGAYHSHPSSAPVPSPTDLAEATPDFVYLIAGLVPVPEVRAWHLVDGNFVALGLVRT